MLHAAAKGFSDPDHAVPNFAPSPAGCSLAEKLACGPDCWPQKRPLKLDTWLCLIALRDRTAGNGPFANLLAAAAAIAMIQTTLKLCEIGNVHQGFKEGGGNER